MADATTRRVYEIDAKISGDALNAVRAMQQSLKGMEDAAKSSASSLKNLNNEFGQDKGSRFVQSLKDQIATLGLSKKAIDEYKAAQLNVADAAQPFIDSLHSEIAALQQKSDLEARAAAVERTLANQEASETDARVAKGTAIIQNLIAQRDAIGLTTAELARLQAVASGVVVRYDELTNEIRQLTAEQLRSAEAARELARGEDEAAAADKRHSDAGQAVLAQLRERIALIGKTPQERTQTQADNAGVGPQAAALLAIEKERLAVQAALDEQTRATTAAQEAAAAADRLRIEAGTELLANLRAQVQANDQLINRGRPATPAEAVQTQANAVSPAVALAAEEQLRILELQRPAVAAINDALAEKARRDEEAAAAELKHSEAGQTLLATIRAQVEATREQIATQGLSQPEVVQRKADLSGTGVGPAVAEEINNLKVLQDELARTQDAERERARATEETIAASKNAADASAQLAARVKEEIETLELDKFALLERQNTLSGGSAAISKDIQFLRTRTDEIAKQADALREGARADRERAVALEASAAKGAAFVQSLQDEKNSANLGRQALANLKLETLEFNGSITAAQAAIARNLIPQLKDIEKNAHSAGGALGVGGGMGREIIVLGHELSQGNFTRFGGSLLVFAELANVGKYAFTLLGISVLGTLAVVGGFIALLAKGSIEQDKFNKSLILTGNYAGQTQSSFEALAHSISSSSAVSVGAAHEIAQELVSTGRFGPEAIQHVGVAVADLERLTGQKSADIVKDFEGMTKGVTDWALKTNEKYHDLTIADYAYIQSLEDQGRAQDAYIFASDKLHEALDKQKEDLGLVAIAYRGVRDAISGVVAAIDNIGKKTSTATLIEEAKKAVEFAQQQANQQTLGPVNELTGKRPVIGGASPEAVQNLENAKENLRLLQLELSTDQSRAQAQHDFAEGQEKGIAGLKEERAERQKLQEGDKADLEIQKFLLSVAAARKANLDLPPEKQKQLSNKRSDVLGGDYLAGDDIIAEDVAAIRRKSGNKQAQAAESAIDTIIRNLKKEDAALQEQIKQYDQLGYAADHATRIKLESELKDPSFKASHASPAKVQEARDEADKVDSDRRQENNRKAQADVLKTIALLQAEGDADATNARDHEKAAFKGHIDANLALTDAQKLLDVRLGYAAIDNKADDLLVRQLKAETAATQERVTSLDLENVSYGQTAIERSKVIESLKLEAEARKQLIANPGAKDLIDANTAKNIDLITAAMQRNYDEQRKFETGAKQAFTAYKEAAGDAAAFANSVIGNGLKDLEDALFNFYKTGKLDLRTFIQNLADEFLHQQAKLTIKKLLDEDSIKSNIDKVVNFLKSAFGSKLEIDTAKDAKAGNIFGTTDTSGARGIITPNNAKDLDAFRKKEIADQNATGGIGGNSTSISDASSGFATLNTSVTTVSTAFDTLSQGVGASSTALQTLTEGVGASSTALTTLSEGIGTSSTSFATLTAEGITPTTGAFTLMVPSIEATVAALDNLTATLLKTPDGGGGGGGGGSGGKLTDLFGTTDKSGAQGIITPKNANDLDNFRKGEIQQQNAGAANTTDIAGAGADAAAGSSDVAAAAAQESTALTESASSLTALTSEGITPASAGFGTLLAEGITPASAGMGEFALEGITPAIAGLSELTAALEEAAVSAGASGGGDGGDGSDYASLFAAFASEAADGGLMTSSGMLPLRAYEEGGIASSPQIALHGEGAMPEAFMPLPDGKTIPVQVRGDDGVARAYVPLPSGRSLPVTLTGADSLRVLAGDAGRPGKAGEAGRAGVGGLGGFGGLAGAPGAAGDAGRAGVGGLAGESGKSSESFSSNTRVNDLRTLRESRTTLRSLKEVREHAAFAGGGVMTRFGRLKPEHYSQGGITNKPKLAVFGEGRKPEAYVPLEDGKTIPVTIKQSNGKSVAYVPLPSGKTIPVTLKTDAFSASSSVASSTTNNSGGNTTNFASGGIMTSYGEARAFADGGVADYYGGGNSYSPMPPQGGQQVSKPSGNTNIVIENHGANIATQEDKTDSNGDKQIRMIIDVAKREAKAELTSDIAAGRGSVSTALRSRGLDSTRTLQRRG